MEKEFTVYMRYHLKKLHHNNQLTHVYKLLEGKHSWGWEQDVRIFVETYKLDEDVIRLLFTFIPRPWWNYVVQNQTLSEDFIREFKDKIDMQCVGTQQVMSEKFLEEMKEKVAFLTIAKHHRLGEKFIRKWHDKLDWHYISRCQDMSEDFIEEYQEKIYWWDYFYRNHCVDMLSEEFIERHLNDIFSDGDITQNFLWKRDAPLSKELKKKLQKIVKECEN